MLASCIPLTLSSKEVYRSGNTRRISASLLGKCIRILQLLEAAVRPEDLNVTGYRFHRLHGKPPRWSVRVTANYRITSGWSGDEALDVDLVDCH
jgi:proteic killer suppression protein